MPARIIIAVIAVPGGWQAQARTVRGRIVDSCPVRSDPGEADTDHDDLASLYIGARPGCVALFDPWPHP